MNHFWPRNARESYRWPSWHNRSYFVDWVIVVFLLVLSLLTDQASALLPVFERDFSFIDPSIGHPRKPEQISPTANYAVAVGVPLVFLLVVGGLRHNWMIVHHGILVLGLSCGLTDFITVFLKCSVGSLRPDFLARCQWDLVQGACTGNPGSIRRGRQSFPSGHSSSSFAGMTLLSLLFAGLTGAWCFSVPPPATNLIRSRSLMLILSFLPFFWATYVSITRIEDNRHRAEDVVVGGLIGFSISAIFYTAFWPSPFDATTFSQGASDPRNVYGDVEAQELLISH